MEGHPDPMDIVSNAVETIFTMTALPTSHHAKTTARKTNRASHGPRMMAKERANKVKEMENSKENQTVARVLKVRTRVKVRTCTDVSDLQVLHRQIPGLMIAGVLISGMMTGARLTGIKVGKKPVTVPQDHFLGEGFDLGAISTFPLNCAPYGAGDGRFTERPVARAFLRL